MAGKELTLIFYYVPEDKDDVDTPNAFGIKKSIENIRLKEIREQFPLHGEYHFRFKYKHGSEYIWLDLVNADCKLPTIDERIIVKATRKSWGVNTKEENYIYEKADVSTNGTLLDGFNPQEIRKPQTNPPPVNTVPKAAHMTQPTREKKVDDFDIIFGGFKS